MAVNEIWCALIYIILLSGCRPCDSAVASDFRNIDLEEKYPEVGYYLAQAQPANSIGGGHSLQHNFKQDPDFSHPVHVRTWPTTLMNIGEISGISVDRDNNPVIFHRGERHFDEWSFNGSHHYLQTHMGPILQDTILVLNVSDGQIIRSWGKNKFYLPHGLTSDSDGNTWVTDVALHQVMKFILHSEEPAIILGEALVPGSDRFHFCKPTDVAVAANGEFYVADGYCNSRILKYSRSGQLINEWGHSAGRNIFAIPHSVTLIEEQDLVCIADRENSRVICFSAGLNHETSAGNFVYQVSTKKLGKAYAISYGGKGLLYGIAWGDVVPPTGFTVDVDTGDIIDAWAPQEGFSSPHDIAINPKGDNLYVSEIAKNQILKFQLP